MRFFKNSLFMTWLELLIKFGTGIVLLPLATVYLSQEELAYYLFIGTLLGMAYLSEGGLNKVILRSVSYFINGLDFIPNALDDFIKNKKGTSSNYKMLGSLVQTSLILYMLLGTLAGLILYFIGGLVADNIIQKQPSYYLAKLSLINISLYSVIYIVQLRYVAFIQGISLLAKQKRIEVLFGLLRFILITIGLVTGYGIIAVTFALLVSVIVSFTLYRFMWYRVGPLEEINTYRVFRWSMLVQLYPAGWRQATIAWGSYLIYSGTTLLIAQIENINLISSYLLTLRIIFILNTLASAPAHSNYPEISKYIANKNIDGYINILRKSVIISIVIYIIGALFIVQFANPILNLLGADTTIINGKLLYFILFIYFLELNHTIQATFYTSTNHIPFVLPALISGILTIGGGYLVINEYGIWGALIVQFIIQLAFNNWYPYLLNYKMVKKYRLRQ